MYSVFATVAGCPGPTVTTSVLITVPGTITAGTSPTVCANSPTVILNATSSTGSGTWTSSGTGNFSPNTLTGNYIPGSADILAGSVNLTLTSTNNGGCSPVTTTLNVQITPAPTSSAGTNQTVCANNATVSLSGSVTIATGGIWSSSGTGSFVPSNTALATSYVPSTADITSGSFTITLTTTGNGNCIPVANSKVISISPAPVVVPGPNPQVVCKNNPNFQLNGSSTTGSGTWASSGTGTFSSNNILNPFYNPSIADTTNGIVTLTLTSTNNGGCNAVSQTMTLVYVSTLAVNAGSNQVVCSNATVALNGVSTTSAGVWTSGGTGTFSPSANLLNTNFIPSAADITAGIVSLTLTTANNGGCNPISSVKTITITPGPTAYAGNNQTVCANNASVALTGSYTIAGGLIWLSGGTGTFTPNNTNTSVVYYASAADTTAGSVVITLSTTSNGSCNATTSDVVLSFNPAPLVNAGANISVCKNNPIAILNGYSSTGTGTWSTAGSGTLASGTLNSTYTPSTADTTAGSVTMILTSLNNGGCNSVSDTVLIIYSSPPTITAGPNPTVCANNATVALTGTSSTGAGTWLSAGTGSFSTNALNGVYIPSQADITSGALTLTVTSTNNGGCNSVSDSLTVYFTPAPLVTAGISQTVCSNVSSVTLSGAVSTATGGIWTTAGTGTFMPSNNQLSTNYIPGLADTTEESVMIYLTSTGNGNCLQVTDSLKISFIKAPFVNAGPDITLCPGYTDPLLSGSSSISSYSWITSGSGSFSPGNNVLNPVYIPSGSDVTTGTVSILLISAAGTCGSATDTLMIAFKSKPISAFTYSGNCAGGVTEFTNVSTTQPGAPLVSSLWKFDGDTTTVQHPEYSFTSAGLHSVSLFVKNANCEDSVTRQILINPKPFVTFQYTATANDTVIFNPSVSISSGTVTQWLWSFGDASNSSVKNAKHLYLLSGMYIVSLEVNSDSSCTSTFADTIQVINSDFTNLTGAPAVPSGFTPNGDGHNDVLYVKGGPFTRLDFRIFNEWGNEIFRSETSASGWDGTFKQAPQPVGKFIWTVNGELTTGKNINMAGEVILNR